MPSIDYYAAAKLAPLARVLHLLGWKCCHSEPSSYRGECPIRVHTRPDDRRFAVDGEGWYCHGCKVGGHSLDLYAAVHLLPIHEATRKVLTALGEKVPYLPRGPRRPRAPRVRNREEER
jgi:hypothetical protein